MGKTKKSIIVTIILVLALMAFMPTTYGKFTWNGETINEEKDLAIFAADKINTFLEGDASKLIGKKLEGSDVTYNSDSFTKIQSAGCIADTESDHKGQKSKKYVANILDINIDKIGTLTAYRYSGSGSKSSSDTYEIKDELWGALAYTAYASNARSGIKKDKNTDQYNNVISYILYAKRNHNAFSNWTGRAIWNNTIHTESSLKSDSAAKTLYNKAIKAGKNMLLATELNKEETSTEATATSVEINGKQYALLGPFKVSGLNKKCEVEVSINGVGKDVKALYIKKNGNYIKKTTLKKVADSEFYVAIKNSALFEYDSENETYVERDDINSIKIKFKRKAITTYKARLAIFFSNKKRNANTYCVYW